MGAITRAPNRKKKPAKRPKRRRRRFGLFAFTLALPIVAFVGFALYRFLTEPKLAQPAPSRAEIESLDRLLERAGFARERITSTGGKVVLETFTSPDEVMATLRKKAPSAVVRKEGSTLLITRGDRQEQLSIVQLRRGESGDFVEADVPPKHPINRPRGNAREIVLILDDVGFEGQPIEEAASIRADLNFAIIPGTPRATDCANLLASRGFEILCHLPMEPNDPRKAPGENAILTSMPDPAVRQLAEDDIASIPHVRGVNNHMGSRATRDERVMRDVLGIIRSRNLYFIDSRTSGSSIAARVARDMGVPTAQRDVFLDDVETKAAIRRQIAALAESADRHHIAVGIGHMHRVTIDVLRDEIPRLQRLGYRFIHASKAVR
jgi:uncharacterized protein